MLSSYYSFSSIRRNLATRCDKELLVYTKAVYLGDAFLRTVSGMELGVVIPTLDTSEGCRVIE